MKELTKIMVTAIFFFVLLQSCFSQAENTALVIEDKNSNYKDSINLEFNIDQYNPRTIEKRIKLHNKSSTPIDVRIMPGFNFSNTNFSASEDSFTITAKGDYPLTITYDDNNKQKFSFPVKFKSQNDIIIINIKGKLLDNINNIDKESKGLSFYGSTENKKVITFTDVSSAMKQTKRITLENLNSSEIIHVSFNNNNSINKLNNSKWKIYENNGNASGNCCDEFDIEINSTKSIAISNKIDKKYLSKNQTISFSLKDQFGTELTIEIQERKSEHNRLYGSFENNQCNDNCNIEITYKSNDNKKTKKLFVRNNVIESGALILTPDNSTDSFFQLSIPNNEQQNNSKLVKITFDVKSYESWKDKPKINNCKFSISDQFGNYLTINCKAIHNETGVLSEIQQILEILGLGEYIGILKVVLGFIILIVTIIGSMLVLKKIYDEINQKADKKSSLMRIDKLITNTLFLPISMCLFVLLGMFAIQEGHLTYFIHTTSFLIILYFLLKYKISQHRHTFLERSVGKLIEDKKQWRDISKIADSLAELLDATIHHLKIPKRVAEYQIIPYFHYHKNNSYYLKQLYEKIKALSPDDKFTPCDKPGKHTEDEDEFLSFYNKLTSLLTRKRIVDYVESKDKLFSKINDIADENITNRQKIDKIQETLQDIRDMFSSDLHDDKKLISTLRNLKNDNDNIYIKINSQLNQIRKNDVSIPEFNQLDDIIYHLKEYVIYKTTMEDLFKMSMFKDNSDHTTQEKCNKFVNMINSYDWIVNNIFKWLYQFFGKDMNKFQTILDNPDELKELSFDSEIQYLQKNEPWIPDYIKMTEFSMYILKHRYIDEYLMKNVLSDSIFKNELIDSISNNLDNILITLGTTGNRNKLLDLFKIDTVYAFEGIHIKKFYNEFFNKKVSPVLNDISRLYAYRNINSHDVVGENIFRNQGIDPIVIDNMFIFMEGMLKQIFNITIHVPKLCEETFIPEKHDKQTHTNFSTYAKEFSDLLSKLEKHYIYDLYSPGIVSKELDIEIKPVVKSKV